MLTLEMRVKFFFLSLLLFSVLLSQAQLYKVSGIVMDNKKEPLQLASVEVKELKKGTVTKDDGSYSFFLERGKYDLVVSMVGFKTRVVTFYINNEDITENVMMEFDESANLGEVILKVKTRDRAEELIRNVIRTKEPILNAIGAYSCNVYIRAFQLDSGVVKRHKPEQTDSLPRENFEGMSMTEVSLRLDKGSGSQIREERLGVNKRGGHDESLFYLNISEGVFYMFNNMIQARRLSNIPFFSPLSYSGLMGYKFKNIKIDRTVKP